MRTRREKEKERQRVRRSEPPSTPLWINYPESSRGAAPWRIASTPSHVFVNSHSGVRAGCRSTALKYLSIIRSVRAEPSRIGDSAALTAKSSRSRGREYRYCAIALRDRTNVRARTFSNEVPSRVRSHQSDDSSRMVQELKWHIFLCCAKRSTHGCKLNFSRADIIW